MKAAHQVLKLEGNEKFLIYYSIDSLYPPHWHEALELVYALDDGIRRDRLNMIFSYIEENYTKPIGLSEISEVSHFSPYHFTRFFKENTGITFNQYLNRLRISKSLSCLTETTDTITDIAYSTGFGSIKTYNRVFKALNGCSPRQYRRQYALQENSQAL